MKTNRMREEEGLPEENSRWDRRSMDWRLPVPRERASRARKKTAAGGASSGED
jgi:hypothetical protein